MYLFNASGGGGGGGKAHAAKPVRHMLACGGDSGRRALTWPAPGKV